MTKPTTPPPPPTPNKTGSGENRSLVSSESQNDTNLVISVAMAAITIFVITMVAFLLGHDWKQDWHRYRSLADERKGNWNAAIYQLKYLTSMEPKSSSDLGDPSKDVTYLSELGYCYEHLGDHKAALDYFMKAQKYRTNIPPDEQGNPRPPADFRAQIGRLNFELGHYDTARKYLQEALQANKLDQTANFYMGELTMHDGQFIKAADYYKVVARDPGYEVKVKKRYAEIEQKVFGKIQ